MPPHYQKGNCPLGAPSLDLRNVMLIVIQWRKRNGNCKTTMNNSRNVWSCWQRQEQVCEYSILWDDNSGVVKFRLFLPGAVLPSKSTWGRGPQRLRTQSFNSPLYFWVNKFDTLVFNLMCQPDAIVYTAKFDTMVSVYSQVDAIASSGCQGYDINPTKCKTYLERSAFGFGGVTVLLDPNNGVIRAPVGRERMGTPFHFLFKTWERRSLSPRC